MQSILLFIFMICTHGLYAQLTVIVDTFPSNTPVNDDIYIAGDFQGWDPGDPSYKLEFDSVDDKYWITINPTPPAIKYKFTRGNWTTVEGNANGGFRPDRSLTFSNGDTVYHTVLSWEDLGGGGCTSTASQNVMVYDSSFYMPQLNSFRRVWVYLPSDYNTSSRRYQTLYIHDGQNVFDDCTSFIGEWGVDESLNMLEMAGDSNIIVVGIDNGGVDRIDEYSPWFNPNFGGGDGDDYMKFIVDRLKPHIDSVFRTKPGREYTGLMGSSMGGLISFYGVLKYQNVFSKGGIFSPSFWFAPDSLTNFIKNNPKTHDVKFYMLMGGMEGLNAVNNMLMVADSLKSIGFTDSEIRTLVPSDGQHSEWFWKREFPAAYEWLYWNKTTSVTEIDVFNEISVFPNPAWDRIEFNQIDEVHIQIFDAHGRAIWYSASFDQSSIDVKAFSDGLYILKIVDRSGKIYHSKFLKLSR